MKTIHRLTAIAICASLVGCAVQQPARTSTGWTKADVNAAFAAQENRCEQSLLDPRLDPIRKYIPFGNDATPTIEQLASKKKPNASEKEAVLVLDGISTVCFEERIQILKDSGAPSRYSDVYQDHLLSQRQARARLWSGQSTFGDYVNASTENRQKASERWRAVADSARANELQQAQAIAQQQQANAQTLMLFNQAMSKYRPVQTNCYKVGGQTSCTSY